jgi:hypothetical protein
MLIAASALPLTRYKDFEPNPLLSISDITEYKTYGTPRYDLLSIEVCSGTPNNFNFFIVVCIVTVVLTRSKL